MRRRILRFPPKDRYCSLMHKVRYSLKNEQRPEGTAVADWVRVEDLEVVVQVREAVKNQRVVAVADWVRVEDLEVVVQVREAVKNQRALAVADWVRVEDLEVVDKM